MIVIMQQSCKPYTWECVTIVEQRGQRQHVYICAETPLRDKTSDASTRGAEISSGEIPAIEVKGSSKFLMFPTPNTKKNGDRYRILDTRELKFFNKEKKKLLEEYLNDICIKYDIKYLENYQNNNGQIPISELYSGNSKIPKGHNRHGGLLQVMSSMIIRNYGTIPLETLKEWCMDLNVKAVCKEPLSDKEFAKEWQQALRWGPVREKMEEVEKKSTQSQVREGGLALDTDQIRNIYQEISHWMCDDVVYGICYFLNKQEYASFQALLPH